MNAQLLYLLQVITGLFLGLFLGAGYGLIQDAARRRNERRQMTGDLKNAWSLMPGSGARVAYLLVTLALIQLLCPLLFRDGIQWWVSGGVAAGYAYTLFRDLRRRIASNVNN